MTLFFSRTFIYSFRQCAIRQSLACQLGFCLPVHSSCNCCFRTIAFRRSREEKTFGFSCILSFVTEKRKKKRDKLFSFWDQVLALVIVANHKKTRSVSTTLSIFLFLLDQSTIDMSRSNLF